MPLHFRWVNISYFSYVLTHILDPLPVICPGLGLDGASSEELVVLGSPHPEVLHELDGVIPLLVSMGPEQFSNIG